MVCVAGAGDAVGEPEGAVVPGEVLLVGDRGAVEDATPSPALAQAVVASTIKSVEQARLVM